MNRTGYVLVGGRSSRMGRDKALLPFRGATLAQYVAGEVCRAAGAVTLVGDPALYGALGYPAIPDAFPEAGPLGGIVTALRHSCSDWNLIVACDMPGVTAPFLEELLQAAEAAPAAVLLPVNGEGRPEPMCAVWNRRCLASLEQALAAGVRKVRDALTGLPTLPWIVTQPAHFKNVNTPEDWIGHAAG